MDLHNHGIFCVIDRAAEPVDDTLATSGYSARSEFVRLSNRPWSKSEALGFRIARLHIVEVHPVTESEDPMINPRYAIYAEKHGRKPDEQRIADRAKWPGGTMCGFILWIQKHLAAWRDSVGHPSTLGLSLAEHDAFTEYLRTTPPEEAP